MGELIEALDTYIPEPERDTDKPYLMPIEDVFTISGRGTVVTGRIERGIVKVGEEVEIVGISDTKKTVATGVEMFRKLLDEGRAGDNVGVLLRGTGKDEVERGMVLAKPGSITPHTKFKGEVYVLTKEEGRQAHAVFQRVQAAVLLQDNGRNRGSAVTRGSGDGDAWRQRYADGGADNAYSDGEGVEICGKGRRQDGWCRCGHRGD